jgi:putative tricarboxylic transport membrane protein
MKKLLLAVAFCVVLFAGVLIAPLATHAETYPSRPITLIVPYPAGGPTDQLARQIGPKLAEKLGQSVIIENVSGGGTNIAGQRVARATPDGYTLLLHNLQISANVALYPTLPFDTEKDLTPIAFINRNPLVLTGRKSLAAKTLPELVDWMKSTPAKMAHPGTGSTGHLATFLLAQAMGVKVDHIPYRGAAPALQDVVGGHVDLFFATPQQVVGQVASGEIKAFGITSSEPSPLFPGVQPFSKTYGSKLEVFYWHALFTPAGTPRPVIDQINAALQSTMDDPALLKAWAETGTAPYPKEQRTPEGAAAYLKKEIAHWGAVVRENHIEPPTN